MIREQLKSILIKLCKSRYRKSVQDKSRAYDSWERQMEHTRPRAGSPEDSATTRLDLKTQIVPYANVWREMDKGGQADHILIFVSPKGKLARHAVEYIKSFFMEHPQINVVYGDEDELNGRGHYAHPYFKPDWSPDTYLNAFYIGSVFACRASAFAAASGEYDNALRMLGGMTGVRKGSPEAVGREASLLAADVLFCMLAIHERAFGRRKGADRFPIGHIQRILFHRQPDQDVFYGRGFHNSRHMIMRPTTISVIIPTKDNPELLRDCLRSIVETTNEKNLRYEIVVVDNGSSAFNRVKYGSFINDIPKKNGLSRIRYLYKVEDFNFSHMCNRGVARSGGDYLLFLNDDVEAVTDGWMRELLSQAQLGHVGVAGCKLLYPPQGTEGGDDLIQHCGITNVRLGPVHKLQRMHDTRTHYFGFNRGIHDLIGVTGACLMISRDKYTELGGLPEDLPVAFNDVDLCYKAHEAGYYNVCCSHVTLLHHESFTRGDDTADPRKVERLTKEYETLMKRHIALYNKDPFYSPYLTDDETISAIIPKEDFLPVLDIPYHKLKLHEQGYPGAREDKCLRVGVEYTGTMEHWLYGFRDDLSDDGYFIKGYSFVIGSDNAFFLRRLVLRQVERIAQGAGARPASSVVYSMPIYECYRPDIRLRLGDQINVDLTGFKVRIRDGELPPGFYQVGMVAIDRTSSLRLINWVPNLLSVKK